MAALQFSCPHCTGVFQVDSGMSGQQVACPYCHGIMVVPAMGGPLPPTTPPQVSPVTAAPQSPSVAPTVRPVAPSQAPQTVPAAPAPANSPPAGKAGESKPTPANRPLPVTPKTANHQGPATSSTPVKPAPLPVADGPSIRVREPIKTVGEGDDEIELRSLTSEEKARRRMIKNLVIWGVGIVIIALTLLVLLFVGPINFD